MKYSIKWYDAKKNPPKENGMDHGYLISDCTRISIGWFEPEFFEKDDPEWSKQSGITYSSSMWHDDIGDTESKYWAYLPQLP